MSKQFYFGGIDGESTQSRSDPRLFRVSSHDTELIIQLHSRGMRASFAFAAATVGFLYVFVMLSNRNSKHKSASHASLWHVKSERSFLWRNYWFRSNRFTALRIMSSFDLREIFFYATLHNSKTSLRAREHLFYRHMLVTRTEEQLVSITVDQTLFDYVKL